MRGAPPASASAACSRRHATSAAHERRCARPPAGDAPPQAVCSDTARDTLADSGGDWLLPRSALAIATAVLGTVGALLSGVASAFCFVAAIAMGFN